jgi:hypothetical protein
MRRFLLPILLAIALAVAVVACIDATQPIVGDDPKPMVLVGGEPAMGNDPFWGVVVRGQIHNPSASTRRASIEATLLDAEDRVIDTYGALVGDTKPGETVTWTAVKGVQNKGPDRPVAHVRARITGQQLVLPPATLGPNG